MADQSRETASLGAVQQTLFIPLAARAQESRKKRPLLRDPKAAEIVASVDFDMAKYGQGWGGGFVTVPRTAIFDIWVSDFLTAHPAGTVVEIGTGLNTRFERVDNGQVHWIDMDLPDTIELRRRFFADSIRRRMLAASALDEDWLATVQDSPGPYFFVADGVLTYLAQAPQVIARIAGQFPGAFLAFDTYPSASWSNSASWRPGRTSTRAGRGPATTRVHWSPSACSS
jgi:O-methyltransferase involved in polyketide biosynthesis